MQQSKYCELIDVLESLDDEARSSRRFTRSLLVSFAIFQTVHTCWALDCACIECNACCSVESFDMEPFDDMEAIKFCTRSSVHVLDGGTCVRFALTRTVRFARQPNAFAAPHIN